MTRSAGLCEFKGAGGIQIRLSPSLLQFRSNTDIKETLLHEMIHAVTFLDRSEFSRDGHGPAFLSHMNNINDHRNPADPFRPFGGYKISVYHKFVDEVRHFQKHMWQCDRCCNLIRRAYNRTPSEKDCLYYRKDHSKWKYPLTFKRNRCGDVRCMVHNHIRLCGGQYIRISNSKDLNSNSNKGRKQGEKKSKPKAKKRNATKTIDSSKKLEKDSRKSLGTLRESEKTTANANTKSKLNTSSPLPRRPLMADDPDEVAKQIQRDADNGLFDSSSSNHPRPSPENDADKFRNDLHSLQDLAGGSFAEHVVGPGGAEIRDGDPDRHVDGEVVNKNRAVLEEMSGRRLREVAVIQGVDIRGLHEREEFISAILERGKEKASKATLTELSPLLRTSAEIPDGKCQS
ncbi:hypothetical protein AAMO2058_000941800 [Amorphochlora amoebiformis]|uniref:SprT-like domain-containing protein n=1 Tax=Amorphochlora amoebiformis TaxID=1561963 RepID=A0A7S0DE73_9EUKA|mmetsp:Transcript_24702/g.38987  ORF Transcript_24702/g.38987 Transcript_24702/m.38987 type:complete len:401 (+) Transcript_24702:237-1439(+)